MVLVRNTGVEAKAAALDMAKVERTKGRVKAFDKIEEVKELTIRATFASLLVILGQLWGPLFG